MIQKIKNRIRLLQSDPHMREVASGTFFALILKIAGSGLTFGFNVAVARLLGAEGAGLYFLALAITTIGSVIGRVGLDNTLLRFIASSAAHDDWAGVQGVYRLGMRMAVIVSGVVTLLIFLLAPWVAIGLFDKPQLAEPLRWMSLSILPFALMNLQAESLKGLKRIRDAMVIQGVGVPLIGLVLIIPLVKLSGVVGVSFAYVIGNVLVVVLGMWAWRRAVLVHEGGISKIPVSELWESCRSLLVVALLNRAVLPWLPLFVLGYFASSDDVGVFGAASRVAMLVSFMLAAVNNVVAPKFAELYARNDMVGLGQTARRSALMITLLASPIFIVLIFAGGWVMSLFGDEFREGGMILGILAAGQLINVMTGSVGYLLMMSGNEKVFKILTMWSTLLLLMASIVFIPMFAGLGAAIAASLAVAANNLGAAWIVYRRLGIKTIAFA